MYKLEAGDEGGEGDRGRAGEAASEAREGGHNCIVIFRKIYYVQVSA